MKLQLAMCAQQSAQIIVWAVRQTHAKTLLYMLPRCQPVQQCITYKVAVLSYKLYSTATMAYLSCYIRPRAWMLHSATVPLMSQPITKVDLLVTVTISLHLLYGTLCLT